MKITIIGHAGSGKSTLAKKISEKLNISCMHIDDFWFEFGGHKLDYKDEKGKEEVRARIRKRVEDFLRKNKNWVSDGWYKKIQPLITNSADQIIFLDVSTCKRLFNHFKRIISGKNRRKNLTLWLDFSIFGSMSRS